MYPPLPPSDRSSASSAEKPKKIYQSAAYAAAYAAGKKQPAGPTSRITPPAADSQTKALATTSAAPLATISAPENCQPRPALPRGTPDELLPTGPIGETMKHRL